MTVSEAIRKIVGREDLTVLEAEAVLEQVMSGEWTDAQIGSLLTALRMKGETMSELTGFARVMRRKAAAVTTSATGGVLIDTCGTGGDLSGSFNVSTAAAFVAAGAGLRVAKHGNRSASSRCGSADVMEALGVRIDLSSDQVGEAIDQIGIGFLFAPNLHGAMKYVAAARRQMGIRTIFNMLGPLTNPAGARNQLIGVYEAGLTEVFARALRELGSTHVLIVHGNDGMDEISICAESTVSELKNGEILTYILEPEEFGLARASHRDIIGGDAQTNADIVVRVLSGEKGPPRDIVILNSAAALVAGDKAADLMEGLELARDSIDSGRALDKLNKLVEFTAASS